MNRLKDYIKSKEFDYTKSISIDDIHDILLHTNQGVYIEWLTSCAWEWEMNLYLDYYDSSIDAIVLITDMKYSYGFDDDDDLYDFIIKLLEKVREYKEKLLVLKKE